MGSDYFYLYLFTNRGWNNESFQRHILQCLYGTLGRVVKCHVSAVSGRLTDTGTTYSRPAPIQTSSGPCTSWLQLTTSITRTTGAHCTLSHTHTHAQHESDTSVKATGMIIVTRWLLENNLNVCWAMVLHTRNLGILRYSRPDVIGDRRHTYIYTYKQTLDDAHDSQAQGLNLIGGDTIC